MTKTITLLAISVISVAFAMSVTASNADAAIFVKIADVPGDPTIDTEGYNNGEWFKADNFSFSVEREMKESGEKGGTADINIGIGELKAVTIQKEMDTASAQLAQFAINGNSPGTAEIDFVEIGGSDNEGKPFLYLKYKLDRVTIKSWSISGDADDRPTEEISIYYNKIAFAHQPTIDTERNHEQAASWDVKNKSPWDSIIESLLDAVFPTPEPPRS